MLQPAKSRSDAHRLVTRFALTLLIGVGLFNPSAAVAQDQVPETGLNAPSDMAQGTAPATAPSTEARNAGTALATENVSGGLPVIRLTPRDVRIPNAWRGKLDLAGEWKFKFDVPEGFDGTAASIEQWDKAQIPGHFSWQGFPEMHKDFEIPVAWSRTFKVPDGWDGLRVRVRFESADGYCEVFVNGKLVGISERVNTPSEFDITDALVDGENELTVTLARTLGTYWSKRTMGGLARGVYLQAVPPVSLARLHVTSDLKETPTSGDDTVRADALAHIRVANDTDQRMEGLKVRFTMADSGSQAVPIMQRNTELPLAPIEPGTMLQLSLPLPVNGVKAWSAEHPNLYDLTCELLDAEGELVMTAKQRFGFRELETRDGKLFLNGTPIKLRGANYHMTFPGYGYFMTPDQIRKDLALFHNMNLNVLRSRPVPGIEYLEACDELGMYTTVEGMFTLMMYDRGPQQDNGADPSVAPGLREHLAAMIESSWSSPSIISYGLGNENPYYDYFREAAASMQSMNLGVPLFFGSDARLGVDIDYMDINDDHYPRDGKWNIDERRNIEGAGWDYPKDRPNFFTEWAHIAALNIKEYKFDPATDDYYGFIADLHANYTYDNPHILGGFLFLGAPEVKIGATFPWRGFFDEYRRPYDMAYHVRKANSPLRIENPTLQPVSDDPSQSAFQLVNRYDFTNASELTARWQQGSRQGEARFDVPPQSTATVSLPVDPNGEPVRLWFVAADGSTVDAYRLTRPEQVAPTLPEPATSSEMVMDQTEQGITVTVGQASFGFDADGLLVRGDLDGTAIIKGRPEVVARPTQFRNFQGNNERTLVNQAQQWKADEVSVEEGNGRVTVTAKGRYTEAAGTIITMIYVDGTVNVSYDLTWDGGNPFKCFTWGYAVRLAPEVDELRWVRDAQWSVYPPDHIGRAQGIAPAGGDPEYASARAAYVEGLKTWPWSQDILDGVSNDFRSTKFQIFAGGLYRANGAGLTVIGDDTDTFNESQHLRASPVGSDIGGEIFTKQAFPDDTEGYWLEVLEYHFGSSDPHFTKSLYVNPLMIEKGVKLSGTVQFSLTPNTLEVDPSVNFAETMP